MGGFSIVGIGSSAGGLEALQKLLKAMPAETGLGLVLVAHLDPTQPSHLVELLGRCTSMPVVEVDATTPVLPDHVYIIAPDRELAIKDGVLQSTKPEEPRAQRRAIDNFLRSLAEDQREHAIGVLLSGTGSSGTAGLRFIKAEGGITVVQEPETASFDSMPRNAIAAEVVDLVLEPEAMPDELVKLARHAPARHRAAVGDRAGADEQLNTLLHLVHVRTQRNFQSYKLSTLLRRVHRRMSLHQCRNLEDYVRRLKDDPEEVIALGRDLTIHVTGFFRDPDAWQVLEEKVIAPLVASCNGERSIRVWVPGCSTGEEAYTIAMLLADHAERANRTIDIKIFATDVAEPILATARAGVYPASIASDIGEDRLKHFFEKDDDHFLIRKALRDMVIFASQDVLQDPPFCRLDLVSCRNLLIYLEPDVQKKLLALFHFALKENGHLCLGPSETISGQEHLFHSVSKKWRIYRRTGPVRYNMIDFPLVPHGPGAPKDEHANIQPPGEPRQRATDSFRRALLERHAPASVLIDHRFMVHAFHGHTGDYLEQPGGDPTNNLLALARVGLQTSLRGAIQRAIETGREITVDAHTQRSDGYRPVRITVQALPRSVHGDRMVMVSFADPMPAHNQDQPAAVRQPPSDDELEAELHATREDLRLTMDQMESANEELKASNEEIRSINEELRASNEELETSKEELQSLNEELRTVNQQLQGKVEELEGRTDDLHNLLNGTDVATLFLDEHLRIRWFTPAMKTLLELLPLDLGRPVDHFAQRFTNGDLVEDARQVLQTLQPISCEVTGADQRSFLRRIIPYRTEDNRIDGVVITFVDISERKQQEQAAQAARDFAESIVETIREPLLILTPELTIRSANAAFYRTFDVKAEETEDRLIYDLGNGQWQIPALQELLERILPENEAFSDFEVEHEFQGIGHRIMLLNGRRLDKQQLILVAFDDITHRRLAEAAIG